MSAAELLALADRCEAATGACCRIDAEIEAMIQRSTFPDATVVRMGKHSAAVALKGPGRGWRRYGILFQIVRYTASIDKAIKLVPEGWRLILEQHSSSWTAELADGPWFGDGPTPALALCAAALRARAAQ